MFSIGEFARFTRVSVTMLRHYDEQGLLPPATVDPATGHRHYRSDQLPRLNRILLLRDLGYGLADIQELLDDPAADVDGAFVARERELVESLVRTRSQLRAIRARRALLANGATADDVTIRPVPSLLVATLSGPTGSDLGALFYELEQFTRDRRARAGRPALALLPEPDDEQVTVAVPLNRPIEPGGTIEIGFLDPVDRMACVVHHGGYAGLPGLLQRMLRWLEQAGEHSGGPIREAYLRVGAEPELGLPAHYLTDERANLVTELQIPLRE